MVHLDRAREANRPSDTPSHASLLLLLRAQALFARRGLKEARAVAAEARDSLPDGKEGTLRSYASIVCGNLALEDGDLDAVESEQLIVGPLLRDLAPVDYQDHVRVADCGEPVRDHHRRPLRNH